jgi:MFS family permease
MCVGVAIQTASQNVGMFIGARFLIGFGLTFAANAAPMLVTEIAYPPYRASLTSLYNSLWYSGNIMYGILCSSLEWLLMLLQCRVDHLRYFQDQQLLVVACTIHPASSPVHPSGYTCSLRARVAPLARQ